MLWWKVHCATCLITAYCALHFIQRWNWAWWRIYSVQVNFFKGKGCWGFRGISFWLLLAMLTWQSFCSSVQAAGEFAEDLVNLYRAGSRHITTYKGTRKASLGFKRDCWMCSNPRLENCWTWEQDLDIQAPRLGKKLFTNCCLNLPFSTDLHYVCLKSYLVPVRVLLKPSLGMENL